MGTKIQQFFENLYQLKDICTNENIKFDEKGLSLHSEIG